MNSEPLAPRRRSSFPRALTALLLSVGVGVAVVGSASGGGGNGGRRADEPAAAATPAPITWSDVSGKRYGAADLAQAKATVFLFSSTQCPIANQYAPRMADLAKDYAPRGVRVFLVNANVEDSRDAVKRYAAERKLPFPAVKDAGTALADRLGASATPEAVVVDSAGVVRYLGRIDDNQDRAKVTRSDVREALDALIAGKPVARARTRAFGCAIFRDKAPAAKVAAAKFTYARDIAPILNQNCVVCHRSGDVGPFALETYAQAKVWASAIKDYTARRIMPPWKPVPGYGDFHDARYLTDAQIKAIAGWADSGAPLGDKKAIPAPPKLHAPGGWPLGTPDLVVQPVKAYHLEAEGKDVYRNFVLPVDFNEDRFISAFDFKPGNRTIVHHIIAYIDLTGASVAKDNQEAEPGWSVSGGGSGLDKEDWGDGWAPGMTPRRLEPGVAVRVPKGAKLVLQVHYHKTGKVEVDHTQVALYFAREKVTDVMRTYPLGNPFFALKPEVAGQEVRAAFTLPFAVKMRGVLPHMHMLGKEMKVTATLPDGTEKPLVWIKNWDFNWQMNYRYREAVALPKGTKISLVATFDNTSANPNQPSHPPKLVRFGEQTTDEMCFAFINFTVDKGAAAAPPPVPAEKASL